MLNLNKMQKKPITQYKKKAAVYHWQKIILVVLNHVVWFNFGRNLKKGCLDDEKKIILYVSHPGKWGRKH